MALDAPSIGVVPPMLACRRFLLLSNALFSAVVPAQLSAQLQSEASSARVSKQLAIYGGPSRLQAMAVIQGAAPPPAVVNEPGPVAVDAPSDRPDIFGSVAIHVSRTPLDDQWRRVNAAPAGAGRWTRVLEEIRGSTRIDQLEAINRWVNARITFSEDAALNSAADRWALLGESARRGRGDCEDYAIAKLQLLRSAGFPADDLYLTLVRDLVRGSDHAVLIVRLGGRFLVLDNSTDRIVETDAVRDYRPIFSFSAAGAWTHGYRRNLQLAALGGEDRSGLVP